MDMELLPAPIHNYQRHGVLKWKAGKKSLFVFWATPIWTSINATNSPAMTQTLSSVLRLRLSLELLMASTSIRFPSALLLHSRSQGGWSQSQLSRVTAGNNLNESPSHRRATQRQTAIAANVFGMWTDAVQGGEVTQYQESNPQPSCHVEATVLQCWSGICISDHEKKHCQHENVSDFLLSDSQSVQVQVTYSNQLHCLWLMHVCNWWGNKCLTQKQTTVDYLATITV